MAYVGTTRELNPGERMQVRFAAELFGWMREPGVAEQGRHGMARFLEELALPPEGLPDPAGGPEAALRRMCESDAGVRLRLRQALRHAPLYVELSAQSLPQFTMPGRLQHAAWLYLMPAAARKLAAWHLGAVECPAAAAAEFLETLERAVADQSAAPQVGATQAS